MEVIFDLLSSSSFLGAIQKYSLFRLSVCQGWLLVFWLWRVAVQISCSRMVQVCIHIYQGMDLVSLFIKKKDGVLQGLPFLVVISETYKVFLVDGECQLLRLTRILGHKSLPVPFWMIIDIFFPNEENSVIKARRFGDTTIRKGQNGRTSECVLQL